MFVRALPHTPSWNTLYTRELANHASDPTDTGTTWFDDSDAESKMIDLLTRLVSPPPAKRTASLLDLGTGNGSLLLSLRREGWRGPALGVDYSPQSVRLARQVAARAALLRPGQDDDDDDDDDGWSSPAPPVRFQEWDVLSGPYEAVLLSAPESGQTPERARGREQEGGRGPDGEQAWDVVLDKGTFDAISLSEERNPDGSSPLCDIYPRRVRRLVRKGGLLLITSCNWTEDELTNWFVKHEGGDDAQGQEGSFVVAGRAHYRTFSFGGVEGQTISTLAFRKV